MFNRTKEEAAKVSLDNIPITAHDVLRVVEQIRDANVWMGRSQISRSTFNDLMDSVAWNLVWEKFEYDN